MLLNIEYFVGQLQTMFRTGYAACITACMKQLEALQRCTSLCDEKTAAEIYGKVHHWYMIFISDESFFN